MADYCTSDHRKRRRSNEEDPISIDDASQSNDSKENQYFDPRENKTLNTIVRPMMQTFDSSINDVYLLKTGPHALIQHPHLNEGYVKASVTPTCTTDSVIDQPTRSSDTFYGLPLYVKDLLKDFKKIRTLYKWQEELLQEVFSTNANYIYSAPTSGGKTLVAELLMINEILNNRRSALFILPYVALVQQKVDDLSPFGERLGFKVEEYAREKGHYPPMITPDEQRSIYVATIEKARCLINSLIEMGRFKELGLIVIDELHMIGAGQRGAHLESLLVKSQIAASNQKINIRYLAMSATLSNTDELAKFLNAKYIHKEYRPVKLKEYLVYDSDIYEVREDSYDDEGNPRPVRIRTIKGQDELPLLVGEVVPEESCLVFCPSKKRCENKALELADALPRYNLFWKRKEKMDLLRKIKMKSATDRICRTLNKTIPMGVAYHHSGLTSEERQAIENAFLEGILSCIACTSTLAAGVNMPATRVIIISPKIGTRDLSKSEYQQMVGRAGRAGFGKNIGESFLIYTFRTVDVAKKIFTEPLMKCASQMELNYALEALILDLLQLNKSASASLIKDMIVDRTLYSIQQQKSSTNAKLTAKIFKAIDNLRRKQLLTRENDKLHITKRGTAIVSSQINIGMIDVIHEGLHKCITAKSINLPLIYLSTLMLDQEDLGTKIEVDRSTLFDSYDDLSEDEKADAHTMGVSGSDVQKFRIGEKNQDDPLMLRFYITLAIYHAWKTDTAYDYFYLSEKFEIPRGTLQNWVESLPSNIGTILRYADNFKEFWPLRKRLPDISKWFLHCCTPELIDLMELPGLKICDAKMLHSAGFHSLEDIAKATVKKLMDNIEFLPKGQAKNMIVAAKRISADRAEKMRSKTDHHEE